MKIGRLLCRLDVHKFEMASRDPAGRFWCSRCAKESKDDHFDGEAMTPGVAGGYVG